MGNAAQDDEGNSDNLQKRGQNTISFNVFEVGELNGKEWYQD